MPNRVANGENIYNESWEDLTRSVFFWLLFKGSDSLGMQPSPSLVAVAEVLSRGRKHRVTAAEIQVCLDILSSGEKPTLVRYEHEGRPFLIFRKWQEWQRIRYDVNPVCPFPPDEALARISVATRELITRNYRVSREKVAQKLASNYQETRPSRARPRASASVSVSVTGPGDTNVSRDDGDLDPIFWYYKHWEKEFGQPYPRKSIVKHSVPCAAAEAETSSIVQHAAFLRYLADPFWRKQRCSIEKFFTDEKIQVRFTGEAPEESPGDYDDELRPPPETEILGMDD